MNNPKIFLGLNLAIINDRYQRAAAVRMEGRMAHVEAARTQ
jgi:hypothetical protein